MPFPTIAMTPPASPARSRSPLHPAARGGRSCTHPISGSARPAVPSRRGASGSRRRCTPQSRCTRSARWSSSGRWPRSTRTSARLFAVPPSLGVEVPDPERLRLHQSDLRHRRGDARPPDGALRGTRRLLLRALARALRQLGGEGRGRDRRAPCARSARATGVRGRVDRHRGTRRRHELSAARRLRPAARGARPGPPLPLRAAEPRLRRLPRFLRALPERVSRDRGPHAGEHGRRDRRSRPPPGRRARRLAALARELGIGDLVRGARPRRSCAPRSRAATPGHGGWPTTRRPRIPGSTSPVGSASSTTTTARGSTTRRSRS